MSAAATGPGEPLALEQLRATAVRRAEAHAEALLECVALGMEPDGDEGIGEGTLAGERKVPEAATGDDGSSGEATDADDADEDDSDDQCRREREEQECRERIMQQRLHESSRDSKSEATFKRHSATVANFLQYLWEVDPNVLTDEFKARFNPDGPAAPHNRARPPDAKLLRQCCPGIAETPEDTMPEPLRWETVRSELVALYVIHREDNGHIQSASALGGIRSGIRHLFASYKQFELYDKIKDETGNHFTAVRRRLAKGVRSGERQMQLGASPLPFDAYCALTEAILKNSVAKNNHCDGQFLQTYLTLMWNLACRTSNAKYIRLSHMKWEGDALVMHFAHMKNDQEGKKKGHPRHIYANPEKPSICPILALGLWLMLGGLDVEDGRLFPGQGQDNRYTNALKSLKSRVNIQELFKTIGIEDMLKLSSHSCRKGAITYVSSGSTACPSHVAITIRGGWTLPGVESTYRQYQEAGDQHTGRTICGLNCATVDFMRLAPMFRRVFDEEHPMPRETEEYLRAHNMTVGELIEQAVREVIPVRLPRKRCAAEQKSTSELLEEPEATVASAEHEQEEEEDPESVQEDATPARRGGRRGRRGAGGRGGCADEPASASASASADAVPDHDDRDELLIDEHGYPARLLKVAEMGLASVLYHLEYLKQTLPSTGDGKHRLWSKALLTDASQQPRLRALRALLWCGLSGDPIAEMHNIRATGIPPHTMMQGELRRLQESQLKIIAQLDNLKDTMDKSMREAIEKAIEDGLVEGQTLTTGNANRTFEKLLEKNGMLEVLAYVRQQQQGAPTGTGTASSSSSSAGDEEDAGALRFEGGMPPEYTALDAWVAYKSGDRALQLYKPRDLIDPSATEEEKKKQLSRWYKFNEYNRLIETLIKEHDARAKSEWAERRRQATEEADSEDRDEEPVEVWKEGPVSLEEAKHMFFTIDNTWTSNRMTQIVYRTVLKKLSVRRRNNAPPAQSVKRRRRH